MSLKSDDHARRRYVFLFSGMSTLFWLGQTVIDPILPLQIVRVGASQIELGWIVSLLFLIGLVSRIPLTIVTAAIGVRRVILLSVASRLLALALYAFARSPSWFYPARVLDAMSLALIIPVLMNAVSRHSLAVGIGSTTGVFLTSFSVAKVVGPAICSVLLSYFTYSEVILTAMAFPLLIPFLLTAVGRNYSSERFVDQNSGHVKEGALHALNRILRSQKLAIVVFAGIIFMIGNGFISAFFAVYAVNDIGLSPSMVALAFTLLGLAHLIGAFPSGILCDRIGVRKPVIGAFATLAVAFLLMSKASSPLLIMLSMAFIGFGWAMRAVATWSIVNDLVEKDRKLAVAYHSTAIDAGRAIGAASSGFLAVAFSTSDIFFVGSGLMLSVLVTVFLFRNWPISIDERMST